MFNTVENFPFLLNIKRNIDIISTEFNKNKLEPVMKYFLSTEKSDLDYYTHYWVKEGGFDSEQIGYDAREGAWSSFPIYKKGYPIKTVDVENMFPKTIELIKNVPNLNFSSFFKLSNNSGTKNHVHNESNLIYHLCLFDLDGKSTLTCGDETKLISNKGDDCLFDYSLPHSSFNFSDKQRINLIVDFSLD